MAVSEARLRLLAAGFRMIRISWVVVFLGLLVRAMEAAIWRLDLTWPPWIFITGLALSVVGLLRCLIGSSDDLARLWLVLSLAAVGIGIGFALSESNDVYVSLGFLAGAFLFHLFAMRMSEVLGLLDSLAELTKLVFLPIVLLLAVIALFIIGLFIQPILWLAGIGFAVVAFLGPLVWLKKLLATLGKIEREIA